MSLGVDRCRGPIETVAVVHTDKSRRHQAQSGRQRRAQSANVFALKCLAYALIGLSAIACRWQLLADCKRSPIRAQPDHSSHDGDYDYSDSGGDNHAGEDSPLDSESSPARDDLHYESPDHPEEHLDQSEQHPDHWDEQSDGSERHPDHVGGGDELGDELGDGTEDARSRADLPALSSKSDGLAVETSQSSASGKPASVDAVTSDDQTTKIERDSLNEASKAAEKATKVAKAKSPQKVELDDAISNLADEGKQVAARRNNTIMINGRKFDQLNPIECVDDKFYTMLMKDLSLINPAETHDEYETYFDSERAMAISAIVDAPTIESNSAFGRQLELAVGKGGEKLVDAAAGSGASRAASAELDDELEADKLDKDMTSQQLIHEIREFWRETNKTYSETSRQLNLKFKRRKRAARKQSFRSRAALDSSSTSTSTSTPKPSSTSSPSTTTTSSRKPTTTSTTAPPRPPVVVTGKSIAVKPNYKKALENHYYLMRRLEELKSMLLNGEEALIVLNNRVKKLQQAVGENELKRALCSCITSRGGRAALMLMSELFTDKNALKVVGQLDQAKSKAEAAARDTAEFCAYWYGDTLRSQAIIKEKQIKRLILKIKAEHLRHTREEITQKQTTTTTSVQLVKDGNSTKKIIHRETRIRVVNKVVEMTRLWRPELTIWIQNELGPKFAANFTHTNCSFGLAPQRRRRRRDTPLERGEMFMSTPFDQSSLYSDVDDGDHFETSAIMQSFVANNFGPALWRGRREAGSSTTTKSYSTSTTKTPADGLITKTKSTSTKRPAGGVSTIKSSPTPSTTLSPSTSTTTLAPNKTTATQPNGTANFEDRISRSANRCSQDGFRVLLEIAYDENAILYETSHIKRENKYIETLRESFITSFASFWVEKRNEWSSKFSADNKNLSMEAFGCLNGKPAAMQSFKHKSSRNESFHHESRLNLTTVRDSKIGSGLNAGHSSAAPGPAARPPLINSQISEAAKSVDEQIDDTLEPTGDAYERGARLGFTIGKFIGMKAARQWPDPVELNTFTYDSLFLAGVGHNFSPQQTHQLEDLIVTETAKRIAFTEASRLAFARALHTAYLNGAFVVPEFGVLHGQRAISKRAATEGAQVGFAAASKSATEFAPAAAKFFRLHEHQRNLADPYKKSGAPNAAGSNSTAAPGGKKSLLGRIDEVRAESELNANITRTTLDCGQKTGAIMGALVGLLVTPEAFETYARVRGSLEAVEGEFYRYKLGAMRGYELGESWAILNYTNAMAKHLDSFRDDIGRADLGPGGGGSGGPSLTATPQLGSAGSSKRPHKRKKNATYIPDVNLLSTVTDTDPTRTNVNNVFQFMVVNYGERMVANHSRGGMLTTRALLALDEATLREMKAQSGDLVGQQALAAASNGTKAAKTSEKDEDEDDIFETVKVAGELRGELHSVKENASSFPLRLEILDLGPMIEFSDDTVNKSHNANRSDSLEAIPLTEALSKVNKIYVKLRVARQSGSDVGTAPAADVLEAYLNSDQTDGGDGFMCGSYSLLGALGSSDGAGKPQETGDDLALEAAILDELYQRIESLRPGQDAVAATDALLRVSTAAPSRATPLGSSSVGPSSAPPKPSTTGRPATTGPSGGTTNAAQTSVGPSDSTSTTLASQPRASLEDDSDDVATVRDEAETDSEPGSRSSSPSDAEGGSEHETEEDD